MATKVDLRQLAVDRRGETPPPAPAGRRRVLTRFVLPLLLLAGFGTLLSQALWESLSPPRAVTVVPVLLAQSELIQAADTPLFRAAGWVEPRPTPTVVTALAEGVVERLLVIEGQEVREGQVVARLVSADARLALAAAEADVKLREGELAGARAAAVAARARLEQPTHLQADLADAEAALARVESELANLPSMLKGAQAREQFARTDWESKSRTAHAVAEISIDRARSELEAASATVEVLQSRQKRLPTEAAALRDKRDAVRRKLERKIDETRLVAETATQVEAGAARLLQAVAVRDAARLRLDRMEIKAPEAGKVLALVARPGTRLTGVNPGSLHDSSTVVTLYDPARLQLRVDVRLDDVGKVVLGQKVRIETAAVPGRALEGEVLLMTSQADIQKNTLSVKVAVTEPPSNLRPDMLCQATFLAPPQLSAPAEDATPVQRLLVPRQLLEASEGGGHVWVADRLKGVASLQRVEVGGTLGELVEVVSGLDSSDKLIVSGREGLKDGVPIRVVGEDENLGIGTSPGRQRPAGR